MLAHAHCVWRRWSMILIIECRDASPRKATMMISWSWSWSTKYGRFTCLAPKPAPLMALSSNSIRQILPTSGLDITYLWITQIRWKEHLIKAEYDLQTCWTWIQNSSRMGAKSICLCHPRWWYSCRRPDTLSDRMPSFHHQCWPLCTHSIAGRVHDASRLQAQPPS